MKKSILLKASVLSLVSASLLSVSAYAKDASSYDIDDYILDDIVITATRTLKEIQEVPSAVNVITKDDIKKQNIQTVRQVIAKLPGITMDKRAEGLDSDSLSIRGMGTDNILVLVDGVPMNSTYNNNVNLNDIPVHNIERIEVLRGAASSIYGGHAVAGVINITTKKLNTNGTHFHLNTAYGTHNTSHRSLYFDTKDKNISLGLGYENKSSDGYRGFYRAAKKEKKATKFDYEANLPRLSDGQYIYGGRGEKAWEHDGVSVYFNYQLANKKDLTYKFAYTKYTYSYKNPFSYVYDKQGHMVFSGNVKTQTGDIIKLQTSKFYGYRGGADKDRHSLIYRDNKNDASITFFYSKDNYNGFSSASIPKKYTKTDWEKEGDYSVHPEKVYGFDAQKAWTLPYNTILFGINYKKEFMNQDRYDLKAWKNHDSKTFHYAYDRGYMKNTALYLQDESQLANNITCYLGLRYDHFKKGAGHFVSFVDDKYDYKSKSQTYNELSPKIALDFKADKDTNFYISYGHSFNPPPMSQVYRYGGGGMGSVIPNPLLDPEKSNILELGIKSTIGKNVNIALNAYQIDTKDKIAYTYFYKKINDPTTAKKTKKPQYKQYINFSKEKTRGIEIDLRSKMSEELSTYLNFSWQRGLLSGEGVPKTNHEKSFKDEVNYSIPKYIFHSGLNYQKDKVNLLLDLEYVSSRMDPDEVSGEYGAYDAYFLVNFGMNYQIEENLTLKLGIDNLFNRKYFANEATDGRTYSLAFNYNIWESDSKKFSCSS